MAWIVFTVHSMLDFNLSFYVTMVIWSLLLAMVVYQHSNKEQKKLNIVKCMQIGIPMISILVLSIGIYANKVEKDNQKMEEQIQRAIQQEEYNQAIKWMQTFEQETQYKSDIWRYIDRIEYETLEKPQLEYIYENIQNETIVVNTRQNMMRNRAIMKIVEEVKQPEILAKFANILIEENEQIVRNIQDREKNRLNPEEIERYLVEQKRYYTIACQVLQ